MNILKKSNSEINIVFEKFKCFSEGEIKVSKHLSIVIGHNNSGKSKLLDIIENTIKLSDNKIHLYLDPLEDPSDLLKSLINNESSFGADFRIKHKTLKVPILFGPKIEDILHSMFNIRLIKIYHMNEVSYSVEFDSSHGFFQNIENKIYYDLSWKSVQIIKDNGDRFFYMEEDPKIKIVKRLAAERNVLPEQIQDKPFLKPTGEGVTSIIASYLHKDHLDENIVEITMLNALNEILGADYKFNRITAQQLEGKNEYEIYLRYDNEKNQRLALSAQGSGLKTILCVLAYIHLDTAKIDLSKTIFLFEELENNLHPYTQKRLINYIYKFLLENNSNSFVTTHSPFIIETLFGKNDVQIISVLKEEDSSSFNVISNKINLSEMIYSLGVKASDILQANFIIWVEGPSDRVYVKKWLELISNKNIQEHIHYECMFYGGSNIAHISIDEIDNELEQQFVSLLNINRHSAIIFDSDKDSETDKIKEHVIRITKTALTNNIMAWITDCREVECYIHSDLLVNNKLTTKSKKVQKGIDRWENYETFFIEQTGLKHAQSKVEFAKSIAEKMNLEHLNVYDLKLKTKELAKNICKANDLNFEIIIE